MSNEIPQYVNYLANVFRGGRISGWIDRNRQEIEELELLDALSPMFAEATKDMDSSSKIKAIRNALALADSSYLSATNYEPKSENSMVFVRRR